MCYITDNLTMRSLTQSVMLLNDNQFQLNVDSRSSICAFGFVMCDTTNCSLSLSLSLSLCGAVCFNAVMML